MASYLPWLSRTRGDESLRDSILDFYNHEGNDIRHPSSPSPSTPRTLTIDSSLDNSYVSSVEILIGIEYAARTTLDSARAKRIVSPQVSMHTPSRTYQDRACNTYQTPQTATLKELC